MEFVTVGIFLVIAAVVVGYTWYNSEAQRTKRLLADHPPIPVAQLRPGELVRVRGHVVLRESLEAPLGGHRCAAYHVVVEEKHGKNSWREVGRESQATAFVIRDESGECFVDPRGHAPRLSFDGSGDSGTFDNPTPAEARVYERMGLSSTNVLGFNRQLRIKEASLDDGEQASVFGRAEIVEVDGAPALTIVADVEHGLVVTDYL